MTVTDRSTENHAGIIYQVLSVKWCCSDHFLSLLSTSIPGFEDSSLLWSDALCSLHCLSPAGTTTHHPQSWLREAEKKASACLLTSRPWWCTGVHGELALIWGWLTKNWLVCNFHSFVPWPFHCPFLYAKTEECLGEFIRWWYHKWEGPLGLGTWLTSFSY